MMGIYEKGRRIAKNIEKEKNIKENWKKNPLNLKEKIYFFWEKHKKRK